MSAQFRLENISFRVEEPLPGAEWPEIQKLRYMAYSSAIPRRTPDEMRYLTQHNNSAAFLVSCRDPHFSVGQGRLFPDQAFANPTIAKAYDANRRLVGFASAADNVSGRFAVERWIKMRGTAHRYAWLREVVVHPDLQRRGIGRALGALMLDRFDDGQPVSAYTWRENPAGERFAQSLGLEEMRGEDGEVVEEVVYPFGAARSPAAQVRWSGKTASEVQQHIISDEAAHEAILSARTRLSFD